MQDLLHQQLPEQLRCEDQHCPGCRLIAVLWLGWGFFAWPIEEKSVLTLLALLLSAVFIRWRYGDAANLLI
ncbi:hypothetical protein [Pantoea septica]|uniref:hypothetical protein n=1 Tax=Pantoea septica TaxID=472695 RepID=UPI003D003F24